jgi:hypothetical protein
MKLRAEIGGLQTKKAVQQTARQGRNQDDGG